MKGKYGLGQKLLRVKRVRDEIWDEVKDSRGWKQEFRVKIRVKLVRLEKKVEGKMGEGKNEDKNKGENEWSSIETWGENESASEFRMRLWVKFLRVGE